MVSINSTLVGFPALQAMALRGTFPSVTGINTFSGATTFTAGVTVTTTAMSVTSNLTGSGTSQLNTLKVGTSGTVGALNVYPATSAKGSLRLLAANSAGDTVTTITNASQAAARTYTIQDAGTDANLIMSEGAQTINGAKSFAQAQTANSNRLDDVPVVLSLLTITGIAGGAKVVAVAPFAGTVVGIKAAIDGAITATDLTIVGRIGTNAITNGSLTIANAGSAFGSSGTATPSAANTFVVGDILNVTITGGVGTVGGSINFLLRKA